MEGSVAVKRSEFGWYNRKLTVNKHNSAVQEMDQTKNLKKQINQIPENLSVICPKWANGFYVVIIQLMHILTFNFNSSVMTSEPWLRFGKPPNELELATCHLCTCSGSAQGGSSIQDGIRKEEERHLLSLFMSILQTSETVKCHHKHLLLKKYANPT